MSNHSTWALARQWIRMHAWNPINGRWESLIAWEDKAYVQECVQRLNGNFGPHFRFDDHGLDASLSCDVDPLDL